MNVKTYVGVSARVQNLNIKKSKLLACPRLDPKLWLTRFEFPRKLCLNMPAHVGTKLAAQLDNNLGSKTFGFVGISQYLT